MELMGEIPKSIAFAGKYSAEFFNRKGELRHIHKLRYWPLESVLHDKYLLATPDSDTIGSFLNPMLRLHPDRRAKAGEMANHRWLQGVVVKGELEVMMAEQELANGRASGAVGTDTAGLLPAPTTVGESSGKDTSTSPSTSPAPTSKKKKGKSKTKSPVSTDQSSAIPLAIPATSSQLPVVPAPLPTKTTSPVATKQQVQQQQALDALKPVSASSDPSVSPDGLRGQQPAPLAHVTPALSQPPPSAKKATKQQQQVTGGKRTSKSPSGKRESKPRTPAAVAVP